LKREIERFGGTVEKFIGDAVMGGVRRPVAHEDDAERAVGAALRITEAIAELNASSALDLSVRAAVNTSEELVALGARPEAGEGLVTSLSRVFAGDVRQGLDWATKAISLAELVGASDSLMEARRARVEYRPWGVLQREAGWW
jgi:hypothetical protein